MKGRAAVLFVFSAVLFGIFRSYQRGMPLKVLSVGITEDWGALHPALQHSAYGDAVLLNQFEPLVRMSRNGVIEPLAASSWEISEDQKTFRFQIDSKRRFSDGTPLAAADFKKSWEEGLRLNPISANKSGMDILSSVAGFLERGKSGEISGIRTPARDILEVEFSKPMRRILEYLRGVRYAAFRQSEGKLSGTGAFIIEEADFGIKMIPNAYFQGEGASTLPVVMRRVPSEDVAESLRSGSVDGVLYASTKDIPDCDSDGESTIRCAFGQESAHGMVALNGLPGRVFADENNRIAAQFIILSELAKAVPDALQTNHFSVDPQAFLKFQAGRLEEDQAVELVGMGESHVNRLREVSKKSPLKVVGSRDCLWLIALLREAGIVVSEDSGKIEFNDALAIIYKTHDADMLLGRFSVGNGDPDSLYHILGRDGAIRSPMMARARVEELMEEGRSILEADRLDPHYRKVSRALLQSVPFVHLGYSFETIAYNFARVSVSDSFESRNSNRVTIFEPR